ncbi:MAG: 50S ribosomal protein L3 [Phycisphaerales bacterium]
MTAPSNSAHLLGQKVGMTRLFTEDGRSTPVTVIKIAPNRITQVRTPDTDGYAGVQVGTGDIQARNSTMPMIGHDAKAGSVPLRLHREFRVHEKDLGNYEAGTDLDVSVFADAKYVDVIGTSKGKGFQGGMKRHGFKGLEASHGVERKHRSPGSIGGHGNNAGKSGRIKKGKKMAGRLGGDRVTVRSIDVVRVDAENGLLLVKGPIPGPNKGWVEVRPATRLGRSKSQNA